MKVIINGNTFQDAGWNVDSGIGILTVETNESIANILEEIGDNNDIQVYDGDTIVSTWFNSGVKGISCDVGKTTAWIMAIRFCVSILDTNTEEELQTGVSDNVDAILELAELIADMDESVSKHGEMIDEMRTDLADAKETISDHSKDIADVKDDIHEIKPDVSNIKDDVIDLKNKFDSIPNDITTRFTALWDAYNALADRVARLENKEVE